VANALEKWAEGAPIAVAPSTATGFEEWFLGAPWLTGGVESGATTHALAGTSQFTGTASGDASLTDALWALAGTSQFTGTASGDAIVTDALWTLAGTSQFTGTASGDLEEIIRRGIGQVRPGAQGRVHPGVRGSVKATTASGRVTW